jgi:hypothetical protein
VESRLKGYKYFDIERDFFNKLSVPIDGDFKFGVLLLVFVRFLTGNLYRNGFLMNKLNTRCQLNCGYILKIGKALYIW